MRATAAQEPLALIRRLYDAWNSGDVATAAEVLAPDVRWDTFGAAKANTMQQTLAGGSGGTWHLTAVSIDLLVGIEEHVLAFSRRSGARPSGSRSGRCTAAAPRTTAAIRSTRGWRC